MAILLRTLLFFPRIMFVLVVSVMVSGCVTSSPDARWKPVVRHDGNQVHVVKWSDETLSAIASWYTGSSDNLDAIANANPTLDPLRVQQGDQVFIPQNLLKTRADMSRVFIDTFRSPPVVIIKTSRGAAYNTPRIIAPTPYKEKKRQLDSQQPDFLSERSPAILPPQPLPETVDEPLPAEDAGLHLFGPK